MKKLTVIFILLSQLTFAKTWKVNNTSELLKSVAHSSKNDSVIVKKGIYHITNLIIDKPIYLIGGESQPQNYPIFDANYKGEIITVKSSGVYIGKIEFRHVGETSSIDWAGIKVLESSNVTIKNNYFRDCYFGVYLSACTKIQVLGNTVIGHPKEEQTTGNGIHAWKCDSIQIANNYVQGHRDGIYFEFVTNSLIRQNFTTQNIRYGLHFMFSHNDTYELNQFVNNGAGVAVMYTKHVTMRSNLFKNNWGGAAYGILLKDISDSQIQHNQFISNTVGIYLEGCSRTNITQNEFSNDGIAMRIQASCDDNSIQNNNFIANTFDIATNGNSVYNTISKNYWEKYDGYDLNHDGIGDVAYRPVSLFSTLIERVPQTMMLLRSFTASLLDKIEKIIPSLTPENLKDESPLMKPIRLVPFNPKAVTVQKS